MPRRGRRAGGYQRGARRPAHAAFGGYKASGIGRETHPMVPDHYRHTKNPVDGLV
ncbi:hypothetical protein GCM10009605_63410 [Nocardiopsis composta]